MSGSSAFGARRFLLGGVFVLAGLLLWSGCSKKKTVAYAPDLLARVDGREITVTEFLGRLRYLPSDSLAALSDTTRRMQLLNDLIDERLMAMYAEGAGLIDSAGVLPVLEDVQRQAMLRELYLQEVRDKAAVTDEELRRAYRRWREELTVGFYRAATPEEAEWVRRGVLSGKTFAELASERYKRNFTDEQFTRKLRWGETEPALEDAAYGLRVGEVSEPVKVGQVYYVIKLLDRRMLGKPSEEDFDRVAPALRRKLLRRKESNLASQFLRRYLRQAQIQIRADVLAKLAQFLAKRNGGNGNLELFPDGVDSLLGEFELRDSALVTFSGRTWTVEEGLKRLGGVRLPAGSPQALAEALSRALFEAGRDEVLVQVAEKEGFRNHPRVLRDVSVWRNYLAAQILKRRLGAPRLRAVVDSLRAQVPVVILETKLATLELTAPDTTTSGRVSPFRELVFPPWPHWPWSRGVIPST